MRLIQTVLILSAAVLVSGAAGATTPATEPSASDWPAKVVTYEELKRLTPFRLKAPGLVAKGRITGPVTLRVHVTTAGSVAKTALLGTCGNPDLDEAAMHAMRGMKFEPYRHDGTPTEVTLVIPVHVPKRLGRTD